LLDKKSSKFRLVAINQQYCSGRKTQSRKVQMTATLRRRAEQHIDGGGGALTNISRRRRCGKIFSGGGAVRPASTSIRHTSAHTVALAARRLQNQI
jgi:hypothetical protein